MANTLQRMERDGLIRRVPDPLDGCRAIIQLAPSARVLEPLLVQSARAVNDASLAGLSKSRREQLLVGLRVAVENLQGQLAERAVPRPARSRASRRPTAARRSRIDKAE